MDWLAPDLYPVWKDQLRDGVLDGGTARRVGDVLGRIHAATADDADVSTHFATDALFNALRLEPYLLATAQANPDLGDVLGALAARTADTRRVLVHGDFSPKNLLIGPQGPVIVDAECAWYGDPAFDLAFVLNHLLLKGEWKLDRRAGYVALYDELVTAYRAHVVWEPWSGMASRTATLLPALMLARVDGKSPVEYLTPGGSARVRAFARRELAAGSDSLAEISARWVAE
jgi:aminoglycoside phosphotransferase (APT) family kinase protein